MKKNLIFAIVIFSLFLVPTASAELQVFGSQLITNETMVKDHTFVMYQKEDNVQPDFVSSDRLQAFVKYDIYIDDWNRNNKNHQVEWCRMKIETNNNTILFDKTYNSTAMYKKYFFRLGDNDYASIDFICNFSGSRVLEIPINSEIVTPTEECKACQYYDWSERQISTKKSAKLSERTNDNVEKIKGLFLLNFELWSAIFWFILILFAYFSTSLIFVGMGWIYYYLNSLSKKWI